MKVVIYGFIEYEVPRLGVFRIDAGFYDIQTGWKTKEEKLYIIGETDDTYTYRLLPEENFFIPIGVHKTRLVKWLPSQLSLFQ